MNYYTQPTTGVQKKFSDKTIPILLLFKFDPLVRGRLKTSLKNEAQSSELYSVTISFVTDGGTQQRNAPNSSDFSFFS